MWAYPP
jgi:hypothetical protein